MVRYFIGVNGKLKEIEELQPGCWLKISPPFEPNEIERMAESYEIPLEYFLDSLDIDERSRYEVEDDIRLIVVNAPVLNNTDIPNDAFYITAPIGIILQEEYTITLSALDSQVLDRFIEAKVKNVNPADQKLFVLQIFEQTVWAYLEDLKKLNLRRNLIERDLFESSRNAELKQLLRIEKSLVYFVNSLSSNELLKLKMKRTNFLKVQDDEDKTDLFEDIIIDNSQALEMANVYTNILSGTMEAYASIVSNNMNAFIQRLTIVTIILMVPTLVASFFGMNVNLPMQDNPYAFYILMFISIVISLLIVWFFKRKKLF